MTTQTETKETKQRATTGTVRLHRVFAAPPKRVYYGRIYTQAGIDQICQAD